MSSKIMRGSPISFGQLIARIYQVGLGGGTIIRKIFITGGRKLAQLTVKFNMQKCSFA
jgi:hypothetical protein